MIDIAFVGVNGQLSSAKASFSILDLEVGYGEALFSGHLSFSTHSPNNPSVSYVTLNDLRTNIIDNPTSILSLSFTPAVELLFADISSNVAFFDRYVNAMSLFCAIRPVIYDVFTLSHNTTLPWIVKYDLGALGNSLHRSYIIYVFY